MNVMKWNLYVMKFDSIALFSITLEIQLKKEVLLDLEGVFHTESISSKILFSPKFNPFFSVIIES